MRGKTTRSRSGSTAASIRPSSFGFEIRDTIKFFSALRKRQVEIIFFFVPVRLGHGYSGSIRTIIDIGDRIQTDIRAEVLRLARSVSICFFQAAITSAVTNI